MRADRVRRKDRMVMIIQARKIREGRWALSCLAVRLLLSVSGRIAYHSLTPSLSP
jgi:hypothetical protein